LRLKSPQKRAFVRLGGERWLKVLLDAEAARERVNVLPFRRRLQSTKP
jgi:hypothetical protein